MRKVIVPILAALPLALFAGCGGGGGSLSPTPVITVSLSPTNTSLIVGQTAKFTATVTGTGNTAVTWSVNGIVGGKAAFGTIDSSGLYTAPAIPPAPNVLAIRAASVADPTREATASVTVVNPVPKLGSITPASIDAGSPDSMVAVTGTSFTPQSTVQLGGAPLLTAFGDSTRLTAIIPAGQLANAGVLPVTVVTPIPGGGASGVVNLTVLVVVNVMPPAQILDVGQTQQFAASVTGNANQGVAWSVDGIPGGNSTVGTIDSNGLYTAPAVPSSPNTVTVTATSAADIARSASVPVTVVNPIPSVQSISPASIKVASADTMLTISGMGFAQQSVVQLGTNTLATTFGGSTQLTALIPSAHLNTSGTFPVTVVTPSPGGGVSAPQTLTVNQAPVITSASGTTFTAGTAGSFTLTATGFPAPALSETGTLPSGIAFNSTTGLLSGMPGAGTGGTYPITFTASNGVGTDASQNFTLTIHQAPAISSAGSTTFAAGTQGSFRVAATGFPTPTLSEGGALPSAITFDAMTGVLMGAPGANTGGTYNITFTASNGVGIDSTQVFTLTVNEAPAISSASSATFTAGAAGSFTLMATGFPAPTLSATGTLPSGATFNSTTGVLSGTPAAGTGKIYPISLTASNGIGTNATQNFTLTVNEAPVVSSASSTTFTVGAAGSFTATATGFPSPALSESSALPSGVTFNTSTGLLSGTPGAGTGGTYSITLSASNGVGIDATQNFTLTVHQPPAITSASGSTLTAGTAGSFTLTATGFPAPTFSATGTLPSGVTFNSTAGQLSGMPGAGTGGTYPVTFTASNGVGTNATQNFTLTVNEAPAVSSTSSATFTVGAIGSFTVTATGFPSPTLSQTGALPSGVTFNATTGVLGGTPAAGTGKTYPIAFTASNGVGTSATQNFALTVKQAPAFTSTNSKTFTVGTAGSFTVTATGFPVPTLSEVGALPSGVTFDTTTGVLNGTPGAGTSGSYPIVFTASNGVGTDATQNFTLAVNQAPAITSANNTTFTVGTAGSFTVTATGSPTPTLSESGALPSGMTFNAVTHVLGGTPGPSSAGIRNITFTASNGVGTNATQNFTLTVNNPTPVLYTISPPGGTAGAGNMLLTVGGSDFTGQSVIHADATALTTVFGSATQLTATIPSALLASTGTMTITVVSPAPGGGASTGLPFKVWPSYPRTGAGSVLTGPPPALKQIPLTGTKFAVLDWTSKDSLPGTAEDVIAADHALTPMGIPNIDTTTLATATANPFVAVAGVLNTAASLSNPEENALINYVKGGGTLYLWEPNITVLLSDLGLGAVNTYTSGVVRPLTFDTSQNDPLLSYIDDPAEIHWQPSFPSGDATRGYSSGSCTPLATWDDTGDFAVLRCNLGTGRAYVFGWRLRPLLAHPERQLIPGVEPPNTNAVVLDADICRLLMRGSYEGLAASPQIRTFAPGGHHAALIITHDVDAGVSYDNGIEWVDFEKSLGIKSTMLFTTTPYDTGYFAPIYIPSGLAAIQYALDNGFDVEGHSFGHFPDFDQAPYGTGSETASNYMPMFTDDGTGKCCTSNMSVIGELGVSKWLLGNDFGVPMTGFRSGYLAVPQPSQDIFFPGVSATGYRRDSTYAYGLTRGAFPFVAFDVSAGVVTTYRIVEYPVAISDDHSTPLSPASYNDYLNAWKTVIRVNYANNAPTNLLIHPIDTGIRVQILQQLLTDLQNEGLDLWVGDWKTFAEFWEAQGVTNARWP